MHSVPAIRRRDLFKATAAAGVAAAFPFPAIAGQKSPNEKLSIAGIGGAGRADGTSATAPARTSSPCATWTTAAAAPR